MKKILILLPATFISYFSYSQYVYTIKADSVKITNDSSNTELIIENTTRNACGFLFNKGNGRTEFKKVLIPAGTNKYLIRYDTLDLSGIISNATHTGDATGSTVLAVVAINGTSLAALATGILKNTTTTGVPSIAVGSDIPNIAESQVIRPFYRWLNGRWGNKR